LVTDALLASYADTAPFTQAIDAHLAAHADREQPLTEQLTASRTAVAAKARVRAKYQDDDENDRLSAERYDARAVELDDELASLHAHIAEGPVDSLGGSKRTGQDPDMADDGLRSQPVALCGAEGTRTPDPLSARQMRYQLRHSP
jgi:hypothetical protein